MNDKSIAVLVPWHNSEQIKKFLKAWGFDGTNKPSWLLLQHDANKEGCGVTKNRAIRRAMEEGYENVAIIDDDVFPSGDFRGLEDVRSKFLAALQPQDFPIFDVMTTPAARGVPYFNRTIKMPVAAAVAWWDGIPDRDAARQLVEGATTPMQYQRRLSAHRCVMLCGMAIAFNPHIWWPWCSFVEVSRLDDVFMSWLWSREANRRGACFNFNLPSFTHSRQSHVFKSLVDESIWLEKNETLWSDIWLHPSDDYDELRDLIPIKRIPV